VPKSKPTAIELARDTYKKQSSYQGTTNFSNSRYNHYANQIKLLSAKRGNASESRRKTFYPKGSANSKRGQSSGNRTKVENLVGRSNCVSKGDSIENNTPLLEEEPGAPITIIQAPNINNINNFNNYNIN